MNFPNCVNADGFPELRWDARWFRHAMGRSPGNTQVLLAARVAFGLILIQLIGYRQLGHAASAMFGRITATSRRFDHRRRLANGGVFLGGDESQCATQQRSRLPAKQRRDHLPPTRGPGAESGPCA